MAGQIIKIVLDADVIIHFSKVGKLKLLPKIIPDYQFLVLDVVKREIQMGARRIGKSTVVKQVLKDLDLPYLFYSADNVPASTVFRKDGKLKLSRQVFSNTKNFCLL